MKFSLLLCAGGSGIGKIGNMNESHAYQMNNWNADIWLKNESRL